MLLAALGMDVWLTDWSGCYGVESASSSEEHGVKALELQLDVVKLNGMEVM